MNKKSIVALSLAGTLCLGPGFLATAIAQPNDDTVTTNSNEAQLQAARAAVAKAKDDVLAAQRAHDKAATELSGANRAHTEAQQALRDAQDLRDAIQRGEKSQPLKTAETAARDAEEALSKAHTAEQAARDAVTAANQAVQSAQSKLDQAQAALTDAKARKSVADKAVQDARQDASNPELNQAKQALAGAEQQLQNAKKAKDDADVKAVAAANELTAAQQAKSTADQNLAQARQALANAPIDEKVMNSLGFYRYLAANAKTDAERKNAAAAVKVLEQRVSPFTDETRLGDPNDATSLRHLALSIDQIDEANRLRALADGGVKAPGETVGPLLVNHELMAESQVVANYARKVVGSHPNYRRNSAENLAWGYAQPFDGWYHNEKAVYEKAGGKPPFESGVGHYTNIANKGYYTTGYGVARGGSYGRADAQRFYWESFGITTDEYRARLTEYRATAPVDPALKKALEDAQQRQEEAARRLSAAQLKNQQAVTAKNQATVAYNSAQTERDQAQTKVNLEQQKADQALQARLQPLLKNQQDAAAAVSAATTALKNAEQALTNAKAAAQTKQQELTAATADVTAKKDAYELAAENLDRVRAAQPTLPQAQQSVTAAEQSVARTRAKVADATKAEQKARQQLANAEATLKASEARLASLLANISPIQRYASQPDNAKALGQALGGEMKLADGAYQDFQNARVYWAPSTGVVLVKDGFYTANKLNNWLGAAKGWEVTRADGASSQQFANGALVWQPGKGVFITKGAIHAAWLNAGGATGSFGLPTSAEIALGDSKVVQHFEGGDAYWAPGAGAWFVYRGNKTEWERLGGVNGMLGAPTGNEVALGGDVVVQTFQYGRIYWSPQYGARAVHGGILAKYLTAGGHDVLGVPMTGEYAQGAGVAQDFAKQVVRWP